MNAFSNNLTGFKPEPSEMFCQIHNERMVKVLGRDTCKTCAREFLRKSEAEHAQELLESTRKKRVNAAMIPARHASCGFKNYVASTQAQQYAVGQCKKFSGDFVKGQAGNMIMTGRTGTGKTHLACAMIRNILHLGGFARYITSEDMANSIANAWTQPDSSEATEIYRFAEYDLLIVDEYGLHDQHENRLKLVHKVLYSRYDAKKPTIVISNFTTDELSKNLGDRLWSRFQHDGLTVVECNWQDSRIEQY
ncbi:MAG: ATP-binding protein [Acinetobacter sp.]|uniref:ATP-binding protein n=1 Tax=Acinetobacter sp. TaxID=472 RepID=UPI0026E06320|nr:ATP-binding protein [Acinetobacter sp.]MDO5541741.1 ATP-binding protein [Acinetobacter sp.]